jgi:hypothetical protein
MQTVPFSGGRIDHHNGCHEGTQKRPAAQDRRHDKARICATRRWGGPITKQGSSVLRWALVQAAHRAALNPRFCGFYQRQRERHGASRAAVALARKLVVIIFYRWRHALHTVEKSPQVEQVRERTSGGAWSEHRPSTSD